MPEIQPGLVIDERFEIKEHIGTGGFGSVWRGHDRQLDREVAIKRLLTEEFNHPGRRIEIIDEARKIAAISHPNIVAVHDVREFGDELLIMMEFLPGGTLQDYLRTLSRQGNWIDTAEAFDLLKGILRGIHRAHTNEQGPIIHRDLKPSNILFDRFRNPKIADFGLATIGIVSPIETEHPGRWEHEGTFGYKSPEQLRGAQLDPRCDLFNVGLIGFLLFVALHPFTDPRFLFDYKEMVLEPYCDIPFKCSEGIPDDLEEFLQRLLSLDPEDRCQTASEALSELEHVAEVYNGMLLERVLLLYDVLKGISQSKPKLTLLEITRGISLCKRNGFYVQGAFLFEKSGVNFSELMTPFKETLESDYGFCRRRAGKEVEV